MSILIYILVYDDDDDDDVDAFEIKRETSKN